MRRLPLWVTKIVGGLDFYATDVKLSRFLCKFALCDIIRVMISIIENNDSIEICLHQIRI